MKKILQRLYNYEFLSRRETYDIMVSVSKDQYEAAEIASFLTVFNMRPIMAEELAGFRDALLDLCIPVGINAEKYIDIVGTGGDGKNTFNISTLSAVVIAGAGYNVVKHGNYGLSSICGSSNVLEYLGYTFSNDADHINRQLEKHNLSFLHAPLFHPAMKSVGPVRKAMKVRTIFNLLGPLVNPSRPKYHFLGVSNKKITRLYHDLKMRDEGRFAVVYSLDGYDEISLTGEFMVANNDGINVLSPQDLGLKKHQSDALKGGATVKESAQIFMDILSGKGSEAQNEAVSANAGMAIHTIETNKSLETCLMEAKESLLSGKALNNFKGLLN